jgi:hypothetical protein
MRGDATVYLLQLLPECRHDGPIVRRGTSLIAAEIGFLGRAPPCRAGRKAALECAADALSRTRILGSSNNAFSSHGLELIVEFFLDPQGHRSSVDDGHAFKRGEFVLGLVRNHRTGLVLPQAFESI